MRTGGCGVRAGAILVREHQSLLMSLGNSPLDSVVPCKGGLRASQEGGKLPRGRVSLGPVGDFRSGHGGQEIGEGQMQCGRKASHWQGSRTRDRKK